VASVLLNQSEVYCARDELDAAVASCERALAIFTEIGDEVSRGETFRWQGYALRRNGELPRAERVLNEAVRIAVRFQVALLEAEAARELGAVRRALADPLGAEKWLERALDRFTALGAQREAAEVREELGTLPRRPERIVPSDEGEARL
jgi:tetratricopeptide (TPR) repeat protein